MRHPLSRALPRAALLAPLLLTGWGAAPALAQPEIRAAAAAARGDLRAAQIEWRNAVREAPQDAARRAALARISLELGDGEAAEREARAALEHGWDAADGTALLMRAFLVNGRHEALLQGFPLPGPDAGAAGGQVAAGRALAHLARRELAEAREAVELARRLAPRAVEPELAASALAQREGDRAEAEAAVDRALALDGDSAEAIARKGTLLLERRAPREALALFDRAIALTPATAALRLRRAETLLALNETDRARADIEAALTALPGSAVGHYLHAMLHGRNQDWPAADAALRRLGATLGQFPDGFLMLATTKRALGQVALAEDAARRHLSRQPHDPRAARLLATIEVETNRPREALATLATMAARGQADAASLDMLGRLQAADGQRRAAVMSFEAAHERAPRDAAILSRLAAARLAVGDMAGTVQAAEATLALDPAQDSARGMLAFAALYQGDVEKVERELARLPEEARREEAPSVLEASARLLRMDLPGARRGFDSVLEAHPNSIAARMGLMRLARLEARLPEVERLLAEVLRLDPDNAEAFSQLVQGALPGQPRAAEHRAILEGTQAARPDQPGPALALAHVLMRQGEAARAATLLSSGPLAQNNSLPVLLGRAEAHALAQNWQEAERASRMALAEAPRSVPARRQLAALLMRREDARGAELLVEQGLREQPGSAVLLQSLVAIVRESRGLDAALQVAAQQAANPSALPAAAPLRGDLLLGAQRPAEAAQAYAQAHEANPSSALARRAATAWRAAEEPERAMAALRTWLERTPEDDAAVQMLSQLEIEAGQLDAARARLEELVARRVADRIALNNLAWLLAQQGEAQIPRARSLAERAYFLEPTPDVADTLGWILARHGEAGRAVPLLRQAAQARATNPTAAYRLAYALAEAGQREEAKEVLRPALAAAPAFAERDAAQRLLADLDARR
jgi:cellulose synthase operon protein C